MYKIFLTLVFGVLLSAEMIDGVSVVVKGEAITLYEIKKEMKLSNIDFDDASNILIRKKLEESEIKERKITVLSTEIYDDIKKIASRNGLNVSDFYEAARNKSGITSTELKNKIKEKLLSKKLYSAIAYSAVEAPNDEEIKEYYELHKNIFMHPSGFEVVVYQSQDQSRLNEKINNPMFNSQDILQTEQELAYTNVSIELANLLTKTATGSFSPIMPDGKGGYMSFYMKKIKTMVQVDLADAKDQISNMIAGDKREQVLSDYFARLRTNADIEFVRKP